MAFAAAPPWSVMSTILHTVTWTLSRHEIALSAWPVRNYYDFIVLMFVRLHTLLCLFCWHAVNRHRCASCAVLADEWRSPIPYYSHSFAFISFRRNWQHSWTIDFSEPFIWIRVPPLCCLVEWARERQFNDTWGNPFAFRAYVLFSVFSTGCVRSSHDNTSIMTTKNAISRKKIEIQMFVFEWITSSMLIVSVQSNPMSNWKQKAKK